MRWLNLTGGANLPKRGKRKKRALRELNKKLAELNSEVTTRQATPEELASLKGRRTPRRASPP
jgi:hypothetical protein